jgi:metallo-beta-lactamase family protein
MYLQCAGANQQVTGSCHHLKTSRGSILIDCGMYQGGADADAQNAAAFPFDPASIDVLLVTHAHLDHVGRIPKLVKEGFSGTIYGTKATLDMMEYVLEDAFGIMNYEHHKYERPLIFEKAHIQQAMALTKGIEYNKTIAIGSHATAIWKNAGHIYGSAFLEVEVDGKRIGFSGDIGNDDVPILKDTEGLGDVDTLICESTYGDRLHEVISSREDLLMNHLEAARDRGGVIMMPAFSIERTQELLFSLHKIHEMGHRFDMPIFLDSPLAINVTGVYKKYPEYYDAEALAHHLRGEDFLSFPALEITKSRDESKLINNVPAPKMIIAGAGMMSGGRILHHAKRYLSDPASTLLLIGYQAEGTIGRRLKDGAKEINLYGDDIAVQCTIESIDALSGHGDQAKLLRWIDSSKKKPNNIVYVHGELDAATTLQEKVTQEFGITGVVPAFGDEVGL